VGIILDATAPFGIYVMTYPGDYHLSTVLVRSIQAVSPQIPIMILPGEGFDVENHPFDIPVMPVPTTGFWAEIGHQDRDFWCFQGPFEKFLYLDADTLVVKSLDALAQRILAQEGDFIYTLSIMDDAHWSAVIADPNHPEHASFRQRIASDVGEGPLPEFDPEHDFYAHKTFNSGIWASRRLTITESDLEVLNRRERAFYREVLGREDWNWKSSELFFRDQGRLNYLVHKLGIPVYPLQPEMVWVSGASAIHVPMEDVKNDTNNFHLIHWMGAKSPTPSYFCSGPLFSLYAALWAYVGRRSGRVVEPGYEHLPEPTGYTVWRVYHEQLHGRFTLRERLRWSVADARRVAKLMQRWLRISIRSLFS
jgi:hypothetical protein